MAQKISEDQFRKMVRKMIKERVENLGDPLKVDMSKIMTKGEPVALASVKTGAGSKNGDFTKGMKNASFTKKTATGKRLHVDMEKMDKENFQGTKTFVETGAKDKTGQSTAKWSKKAKNEKKEAPIATAIQLPEGFGKKPLKRTELLNFINEEAKRISKLL